MSVVNRTRNIFVNSEEYHDAKGQVSLIFPGSDFVVDNNEIMRLTLDRFEMKRNFYNINKFNNTFYISTGTGASEIIAFECKIPEGDYDTFGISSAPGTLCAGIAAAIDEVTSAPNKVEYDPVTRKITIRMNTGGSNITVTNFYFFQIPPSRQNGSTDFTTFTNTKTSSDGLFNDSYEIFGAKPVKNEGNIVAGFGPAVATTGLLSYTAFYPASLYTMESINLTTNLQTHSYSTPHLDANSSNSSLIPTSIFARIWFDMVEKSGNTHRTAPKNIISYTDPGTAVFSVDLQNKTINEVKLRLTDSKGRDLDEVSDDQFSNGNLNYTAVFKWEAIMKPQVGQSLGYLNDSRQFKPFQF